MKNSHSMFPHHSLSSQLYYVKQYHAPSSQSTMLRLDQSLLNNFSPLGCAVWTDTVCLLQKYSTVDRTRITVPFSDGVARSGPVESMERKKSGDLCACDIWYCENSSRKNEDIAGLVFRRGGWWNHPLNLQWSWVGARSRWRRFRETEMMELVKDKLKA